MTATTLPDAATAVHDDSAWRLGLSPQAMPVHFVATLGEACGDAAWQVQVAGRPWHATRAYSCLVQPQPGDRVAGCLVEGPRGDECHVLAILARPEGRTVRLQVDGDLEVAATGSVRLSAGEELAVQADSARYVHRTVQFVAQRCNAFVAELKAVGETLGTVFKREHHQCDEHLRHVEGMDLLQAQLIDHRAKDLLQLKGENVLANGSTLVKMQGSQIHFG